MTKILVIHAHPDDWEILAGGSIALLAQHPDVSLEVVTMTAGDCGSAELSPEEISRVRKQEAAAAAALIGAPYVCAGFLDLAIFNDDASRRRVTDLLRQAKADIVITANYPDYHCDHEATHQLVRDACFGASAPNYKAGSAPALDRIPHLYFMDSTEGIDRDGRPLPAEFVVDVSAMVDKKRQLIACHESQRAWLAKQHGMGDYVELALDWTRARGETAGFAYGEGFRQYRGHPYPQSPLLQDLLSSQASLKQNASR